MIHLWGKNKKGGGEEEEEEGGRREPSRMGGLVGRGLQGYCRLCASCTCLRGLLVLRQEEQAQGMVCWLAEGMDVVFLFVPWTDLYQAGTQATSLSMGPQKGVSQIARLPVRAEKTLCVCVCVYFYASLSLSLLVTSWVTDKCQWTLWTHCCKEDLCNVATVVCNPDSKTLQNY